MSWQEGNGPAPEPPDRPLGADEHLSVAQGYLAAAEKLRAELVATDPTDEPFDDRIVARITRVRNTSSTLLYSAIDLANAHRAMAVALRDSVPQRIEMRSPFDPDETDRAIREQLAADTEAHQSVTHAPGIDPEPEGSEGDLWTTDGEWFWYAVANHGSDERWIQARYYAHILTWQAAGTRPTPLRWEELRNEDLTGEPDMILRRPNAEERARFYGPEPDPQPAVMEQHERTTTIPDNAPTPPEAACHQFVALEGVRPATTTLCERCGASAEAHLLKMFGPRQGGILARQIRAAEQISEGLNPAPRGGEAQWREG